MTASRRSGSSKAAAAKVRVRAAVAKKTGAGEARAYHHGSLRRALIEASERILTRQGLTGLTLRAAAREAGVSHAAPKNHFGDLSGLLSDLAAAGFERLTATMEAGTAADMKQHDRLTAIGRGYVAFARANPALFLLMFRSERLDFSRPALKAAGQMAFSVLSGAVQGPRSGSDGTPSSAGDAAAIIGAWSTVHGFAMLMLDGRLDAVMDGIGRDELLNAILASAAGRD